MKRKFLLSCGGVIIAALVGYAALYFCAKPFVRSQLRVWGYPQAEIGSATVYLDGIILKNIRLDTYKKIDTVFIKANPLQIFSNNPQFLSIKQANITIDKIFQDKIPFVNDIPFGVDGLRLYFPFDIPIKLDIKQNSATSALIFFNGKNKSVKIKGRGEVYFGNGIIQAINLELSRIDATSKRLKTKRADGWLSFSFKDGLWVVSGEVGAGYADINSFELSDATVAINGSVDDMVWTLTGKDRKTNENVAVDYANKTINTTYKKETFTYETENLFDIGLFESIQNDIAAIKPLQVVVVTKQMPRKETRPKRLAVKNSNYTAKEFAEALQIIELDKKPFDQLVRSSLFEGFSYSKTMTVIDVPCAQTNDKNACWTARSRSGIMTINPSYLPGYFSRMKNYEDAMALRTVLQKVSIKHLVLQGRGDKVETLSLQGKTEDGQSVSVDLSVSDVN